MIIGITLFLIGLLFGVALSIVLIRGLYIRKSPIGALRVDHSDPDDGPYLFLELYPGGKEAIMTNRHVVLSVKIEDYIPHN